MSDRIKQIIAEKEKRRKARDIEGYEPYETSHEMLEYMLWVSEQDERYAVPRYKIADVVHFPEAGAFEQVEIDCTDYLLIVQGWNLEALFEELLTRSVSKLYPCKIAVDDVPEGCTAIVHLFKEPKALFQSGVTEEEEDN